MAEELGRRRIGVVVPKLGNADAAPEVYWRRHAEEVAASLDTASATQVHILVGHSGAGPLLPAIRQASRKRVAAYLFVDAGIPKDGASRLDLLAEEDAAGAQELRAALTTRGRSPHWSDEDLRTIVPDRHLRQELLAEVRPMPARYWEEAIPVFAGWPDAPCGYLQLSDAYELWAARARESGWPFRHLEAGHFGMLGNPAEVSEALVELADAVLTFPATRRLRLD